jgi:predicted metal-dependent HD superfamily phosphohydrolase
MTRKEAKQVASAARWVSVCESMGITNGHEEHARLLRGWSSMGRHYHTVEHLAACLLEFDGARDLAQSPTEVELALWFHDAVYRTWRSDNESRSAEWAARFLVKHGANTHTVTNVRKLVMATAHVADRLTGDAALVVDVDLSILGQPQPMYDQFERNVRREYWWVPKRRFITARTGILRSFLERPSIYHGSRFCERYEAPARANLERAIRALSAD